MQFPWTAIQSLQEFFQLGFLFSGLEVSSGVIMVSRLMIFMLTVGFCGWFLFKILLKLLDCLQELLKSIALMPKSLFLILFLAIPLSQDSIGSKWIGYILLILFLVTLAGISTIFLVIYKYGVEQAMRLINYFRKPAIPDSKSVISTEAAR